ncbi:DUF6415 family natural product biosynthesis protein [Streptomyces sp. NPDC059118]|uniref:DUF6415 family natural product biosynthesis protein n=1 Tax=unclassified Streptomyces TaxID=2593676 RepID=UPI0036C4F498
MPGKVRMRQPYVDGVLLDDVAAVLDDHVPTEQEAEVLATRSSGHLMRLVQLVVASKADQRDKEVSGPVKSVRTSAPRYCPGTTPHRSLPGGPDVIRPGHQAGIAPGPGQGADRKPRSRRAHPGPGSRSRPPTQKEIL